MNMKRGWWLAVFTLLLAQPFAAHAATYDLVVGPSVTAGGRTTVAAFASVLGHTRTCHSLHFVPIGTAGWIRARNMRWHHLNRAVYVAGGGLRVEVHKHWFASEQLVATSKHTDALSSRFEFVSSVGWQYRHAVVMLRHISDGHMIGGGKNMGETMVLVGVRW